MQKRKTLEIQDSDSKATALNLIRRAKYILGYLSIGVGFLERGEINLQIPDHVTTGVIGVTGSGYRRLKPTTFIPIDPTEKLIELNPRGKGKKAFKAKIHPLLRNSVDDLLVDEVKAKRIVFRSIIQDGASAPIAEALNPKNMFFKENMGRLDVRSTVENGVAGRKILLQELYLHLSQGI